MLISSRLIWLALAAGVPQAAIGRGEPPPHSASAPPDALTNAQQGELSGRLMVTPDYDGFWKAWEGPTPPHVVTTDQVARGKSVALMIVFGGCRAGPNGMCDVAGELSMTGPDGKPYGDTDLVTIWDEKPAPGRNMLLSRQSIGLTIDPKDKLGRYTFRVRMRDTYAGVTLELTKTVMAVKKEKPPRGLRTAEDRGRRSK